MPQTLEIPQMFSGAIRAQATDPLDPLINSIIAQESSGRPHVVGKAGEIGLMQIKPQTAQKYGVKAGDLFNPEVNKRVGTQYFQSLLNQYQGNVAKALAAYNWGPDNVDKGKAFPASTRRYIKEVLERAGGAFSAAIGEGTAYGGESDIVPASKLPTSVRGAGDIVPATKMRPMGEIKKPDEDVFGRASTSVGSATTRALTPYTGKTAAQNIGESIGGLLPQNRTEAAIQALIMGLPYGRLVAKPIEETGVPLIGRGLRFLSESGTVPGLARTAVTATGGGLASASAGKGFGPGALQGATAATVGGLQAKAVDLAERAGMGPILRRMDPARAGATIKKMLPELPRLNTPEDFASAFMGRAADDAVSQHYAGTQTAVSRALGNTKLGMPKLGAYAEVNPRMTFDEAVDLIHEIGQPGWTMKGEKRGAISSMGARRAQQEATAELDAALNQVAPGMGTVWREARARYGKGREVIKVFKTPGVLSKDGSLNWPKIQQVVGQGSRAGLERALSPAEIQDFFTSIFRGGSTAAQDVPPLAPHVRFHAGIFPSFSLPRPGKYTGLPGEIGKAAINVGRAAAAPEVAPFFREEQETETP